MPLAFGLVIQTSKMTLVHSSKGKKAFHCVKGIIRCASVFSCFFFNSIHKLKLYGASIIELNCGQFGDQFKDRIIVICLTGAQKTFNTINNSCEYFHNGFHVILVCGKVILLYAAFVSANDFSVSYVALSNVRFILHLLN